MMKFKVGDVVKYTPYYDKIGRIGVVIKVIHGNVRFLPGIEVRYFDGKIEFRNSYAFDDFEKIGQNDESTIETDGHSSKSK